MMNKAREAMIFCQEVAYLGKVGRRRKEALENFLIHKSQLYSNIAQYTQVEQQQITCRKGCSYCCYEYISASLME